MDKYKQTFIDIIVVCLVPITLVLVYHFFMKSSEVNEEFVTSESILSNASSPGEVRELGAKSKEILNQLDSIKFDADFFSDPAYLSLTDFTPEYVSTSTGRDYPFSLPEEVQMVLRTKSANVNSVAAKPVIPSTVKSTSPKTTSQTTR